MLASGFELDLIRNSWRLQREYNWDIFLPDMGVTSGMDIGRYCQEISFGDYTMSEIVSQRYGAYQSKFAGLMNIEDVTFTFLKPVPDIVSAYFYYWRSLIVNLAGYYNVKSQYAFTVKVFMYDTNGAISNTISLIGVFPKTVPTYRMAYGSEKMVEMSITCSVDRFSVGDYVPPYFPSEIEMPVTRSDYGVVIGNDLPQNTKEASNAISNASYAQSRQFATAPYKVGGVVEQPFPEIRLGKGAPSLSFLPNLVQNFFLPTRGSGSPAPVPVRDPGWPTLTIGTPSLPDGAKVAGSGATLSSYTGGNSTPLSFPSVQQKGAAFGGSNLSYSRQLYNAFPGGVKLTP